MKPEIGDTVKIFINTSVIEGKVHQWGKKIILSSDHKDSFMVITKPKDIFMYKVTKSKLQLEEPVEIQLSKIQLDQVEGVADLPFPEEIKEEDVYVPDWAKKVDKSEAKQGVANPPDKDLELSGKTLAELHKLKIEEERKILAQRMKQATLNPSLGVKYELPSFFKKEE